MCIEPTEDGIDALNASLLARDELLTGEQYEAHLRQQAAEDAAYEAFWDQYGHSPYMVDSPTMCDFDEIPY